MFIFENQKQLKKDKAKKIKNKQDWKRNSKATKPQGSKDDWSTAEKMHISFVRKIQSLPKDITVL